MTHSPPEKSTSIRIGGLDTLRIFALSLVTWQHAASVLGAYDQTHWRNINPGQTGVAIFCVISGYLAFYNKPRHPETWLLNRFRTIFPSYWVVTIIAFGLALYFGTNKQISIGLFVSQLLGLGFFTHGWDLINVVSWFVSLILLCYLFSYFAHKYNNPLHLWIIAAISATTLVALKIEVDLSRHILAFSLGAALGIKGLSPVIPSIGLALSTIGCLHNPQFFYSGFGILMLIIAIKILNKNPACFKWAALYSYEYFLIHGILLVAATRYIPNPMLSIPIAILGAAILAIPLKKTQSFLSRALPHSFSFQPQNNTKDI